jgi:hypothetical protein
MLFGLRDAQGWREQIPKWYLSLWKGTSAIVSDAGLSGVSAAKARSPILDLARVSFLIASKKIEELQSDLVFEPIDSKESDLWIYRNPDALPRAYVVHRARALPEIEALEEIRAGTVSLRDEVILHGWSEGATHSQYPAPAVKASVHMEESAPGRAVLTVSTDAPGWLVITDTWYPDWIATRTASDGVPVQIPVERAMVAFRAIPLVAGEQTIRLEYVPKSITLGGILTGFAWIGFLLLPLVGSRREKPKRGKSEVAGPATHSSELEL